MGQWYTQKVICRNGVEERTKFFVRSDVPNPKSERAKRSARREARNAESAERQAARLLNENFQANGDLHLVLEYNEAEMARLLKRAETMEGETEEDRIFLAAQQNLVNFVRRVQRDMGDEKGELRYLGVTADRDGKTGEPVRIHHHFVVSWEAREACLKKWRGKVLEKELYTIHGDFTPLAEYLIRQVRPVAGTKRYVPSRNLRQPRKTEPMLVTRYAESEMKVPRGCVELYRSPYIRGACQYLRYLRPRKE